jgi:hypothetical protein
MLAAPTGFTPAVAPAVAPAPAVPPGGGEPLGLAINDAMIESMTPEQLELALREVGICQLLWPLPCPLLLTGCLLRGAEQWPLWLMLRGGSDG